MEHKLKLDYLPRINYEYLAEKKFKSFEIAEITFKMTHFPEKENITAKPYANKSPTPQRLGLFYIAGINVEKNSLVVGHPNPRTGEFVDAIELNLEEILDYNPRFKRHS